MNPTQFSCILCGLSLLVGIQFFTVSLSPAWAQIEPPPSSGTPSGTVGGGSRS